MKLKDIYKTFYSKVTEYTFFSSAHKTFSSMDYKLSPHNKLKTEIIPSIFSDHYDMKPKINYKKKTRKPTDIWILNYMLLNNKWVKEDIKR